MHKPSAHSVDLSRVCRESQLRISNRGEGFGSVPEVLFFQPETKCLLENPLFHASPAHQALGGASDGPASGRYHVTEKVAWPEICDRFMI